LFPKRERQAVLTPVARQLAQDQRRRDGTLFDGGPDAGFPTIQTRGQQAADCRPAEHQLVDCYRLGELARFARAQPHKELEITAWQKLAIFPF
jgi:hypothetical protein